MERRSDDNEETLKRRLAAFHSQTEPVIDYYQRTGILSPIDATRDAQQVWAQLESLIKNDKHLN